MASTLLPYVEVNSIHSPDACVIWMHGLGDSGHGFAPIVPELKLPPTLAVRFIFPHAPERAITINGGMRMRAWYDIKSMDFNSRADINGVRESAAQIEQLIDHVVESGIPSERIVIAGFSQGGVIALHLLTHSTRRFAGVMALSTYLASTEAVESAPMNQATPVMIAHGEQDEVVPVILGKAAHTHLTDKGFSPTWHSYRMQHNVCIEEIRDIREWLITTLG